MLKGILHTGLAVPNLQEAIEFYKSLGFVVVKEFDKPDLKANGAMVAKGESTFELFQFNDPRNAQVEFIRNHIAIYSDSLKDDVDQLIKKGYKLTIPITEGKIFRYAYVQDESGTNYEIATDKTDILKG